MKEARCNTCSYLHIAENEYPCVCCYLGDMKFEGKPIKVTPKRIEFIEKDQYEQALNYLKGCCLKLKHDTDNNWHIEDVIREIDRLLGNYSEEDEEDGHDN